MTYEQLFKESLKDARYWKKRAILYREALKTIALGGRTGCNADYRDIASEALREVER